MVDLLNHIQYYIVYGINLKINKPCWSVIHFYWHFLKNNINSKNNYGYYSLFIFKAK